MKLAHTAAVSMLLLTGGVHGNHEDEPWNNQECQKTQIVYKEVVKEVVVDKIVYVDKPVEVVVPKEV